MRLIATMLLILATIGCGKDQKPSKIQPPLYESQGYNSPYPPSPEHKQHLLTVIASGEQQFNIPFDETVLAEAMSWFDKGDHTVLPFLLDAGRHSDFSVSELLGEFLTDNLIKQPALILEGIGSRPEAEQRELAFFTASGDGSGLPDEKRKKLHSSLKKCTTSSNKSIARAAIIFIDSLDKFIGNPT